MRVEGFFRWLHFKEHSPPFSYSLYIYFYLAVFERVLPNLPVLFVFSVVYTWQRLCGTSSTSSRLNITYLCLSLSGTHWLCRLNDFYAFVIVKFPSASPPSLPYYCTAVQAMHKLRSQLYCVRFYANLGTGRQFPYSSYIGASIQFIYQIYKTYTLCPYL